MPTRPFSLLFESQGHHGGRTLARLNQVRTLETQGLFLLISSLGVERRIANHDFVKSDIAIARLASLIILFLPPPSFPRHRSRKRRPFSRYAARRRLNSVYREKSISLNGDSKMIEEKLDQVSDLKTQIRCLINDNEEVRATGSTKLHNVEGDDTEKVWK